MNEDKLSYFKGLTRIKNAIATNQRDAVHASKSVLSGTDQPDSAAQWVACKYNTKVT